MTKNQIAYNELLEAKRSNIARETETARSNRANETETHRANVTRETETARHNQQSESLGFAQLEETKRSNRANESIKAYTAQTDRSALAENMRANLAREEQNYLNYTATKEDNEGRREETYRANTTAETLRREQAEVETMDKATQRQLDKQKLDLEREKLDYQKKSTFINSIVQLLPSTRISLGGKK